MAEEFSSTTKMLATPNQAGRLFNASGRHPVRQKHLFVIRFVRASSDTVDSGLTFVVKGMDKPSVEVSTETLNQYNRKKIIHTGVKYNPVNVTFYDTADCIAMNMWVKYIKYHVADYDQELVGFVDDLIDEQLNREDTGWGFRIPPVTDGLLDRGKGTQNYFSHVQVYQVWGGEYTSYSLANPRITNFTPDELTYDSSDISTISMSLQYEGIDHLNGGLPLKVTDDEVLSNIFGNEFAGNTLQVSGASRQTSFVGIPDEVSKPADKFFFPSETSSTVTRTSLSSEGGVLSRFGEFDFGASAAARTDSVQTALGGLLDSTGLNQNAAQAASVIGQAILSLPNMATGINRAAKVDGNTGFDQVSKVVGAVLSSRAILEFNKLASGTFLLGNKIDG